MIRSTPKMGFGSVTLEYISAYKYLGFSLGEFMRLELGALLTLQLVINK